RVHRNQGPLLDHSGHGRTTWSERPVAIDPLGHSLPFLAAMHPKERAREAVGKQAREMTNEGQCLGVSTWTLHKGRQRGCARMRVLVSDLLLFSCLAVLITSMVIVVASLLIS